ncbi:glycosyltransferase family 39 protein [Cylindrobasidium torrendii FP15055 ss-10]|uniref:Dolichyl-phosphate-mannose--protein mannosyltransferase n=1 Tax=Cylindrobasidium torrendii FP15055 ss-10 TaxID=1314674 RepID=A0A0D7BCJ4_9AGAR|nr:glycosyltransferase family 39 protein [Cylindrobasidium torrendii FP15055 ss-10]
MSFRARRPASPPPGASLTSQRFPHPRQDHLDADARREAASKGFVPGKSKSHPSGGLNLSSGEWKLLVIITVLASFVRLYRISAPSSVVFDEVHFGKFASRYIKTQYFMDVHPPLAKLLLTLAAFIFGYDGHFDFKDIGKEYESSVPYVAMRMVPAVLGVATIPLSYLTLRALDCRATTSLLASIFILFENALTTQSRYILLDSPLIFFTALTVFVWVCFCNENKHKAFTDEWWGWLTLSGLGLGAVVSCKWVGLFTIATIGLSTIHQLWVLLGDSRISPRLWIRHFFARALCLIVLPILFYMFMFSIHFAILQSSGEGDGFMSSEFQHTLSGRGMADTFADVALGSSVSIRHVNTQGGYLHSHPHNYPTGSMQQQITLYPHRDSNNEWLLLNTSDHGPSIDWADEEIKYIKHGDKIRLRHPSTFKALHSHDHRPPISDVDFQNEVSAYGNGMPDFAGDANDDWIVEIEHGTSGDRESSKRLRTLRTTFRLRHVLSGCYLFSHKVKLPEWGFGQQEVTCNKNAVRANSLWFVETAKHPGMPDDAPKVNYKLPGFFAKFWELQQVMWTTNAGLTDRHTYDSRPEHWPRLRRGINFWVKDHRQVYLIGNPFVWWLSTLAVVSYVSVRAFLILRAKRGYRDFDSTKVVKYDGLCGFLFTGWALHYFPFFLMGRQLFLHHYLPALYFSILLCASVFDLMTSTLRPKIRLQIAAVFAIVAVWNFYHFSPLVYGTEWTRAECQRGKWMRTWDFSCNDFLANYDQYSPTTAAKIAGEPVASKVATIGGEPGGRGAMVIEDIIKPAEDAEAETSKALGAQPEPGNDIFEGKNKHEPSQPAANEVKKQVVPEDEEKIVSVVDLGEEPVADEVETKAAEEDKPFQGKAPAVQDEDPLGSADEADTNAGAVGEDPVPAQAAGKEESKKESGPLGEAEAVADKIAHELYPEDVD